MNGSRVGSLVLVLGMLSSLAFSSLLFPAPTVNAQVGTIELSTTDGMSVCQGTLGGTWIQNQAMCELPTKGKQPGYTLSPGITLQIDYGVTLVYGATFYNDGSVTILGTFSSGNDGILVSRGSILDKGSFKTLIGSVNNNTGSITIAAGATFTNQGGTLNNIGTINNAGSFDNEQGFVINLRKIISPLRTQNGDITNTGTMHVGTGAILVNNGTLTSSKTFENYGTIMNGGSDFENQGKFIDFDNSKVWNQHGKISNDKDWTILAGALITNDGRIQNTVNGMLILENNANIKNLGSISNNGALVNNGMISNEPSQSDTGFLSAIENYGSISVTGSIVLKIKNPYHDFRNFEGGTIMLTKPGSISISASSTFLNEGSIMINEGTKLSVSDQGSFVNHPSGSISVAKSGTIAVSSTAYNRAPIPPYTPDPTLSHLMPTYSVYLQGVNFAVQNYGSITNAGNLTIAGDFANWKTLSNSGSLTLYGQNDVLYNYGVLTNLKSGEIQIQNSLGQPFLINSGTPRTAPGTPALGPATINNYGSITIIEGVLTNNNIVNNYGMIDEISGLIENSGRLNNFQEGVLFADAPSYSIIRNVGGGTLGNSGNFYNRGRLDNFGNFNNFNGGTFVNGANPFVAALLNNTGTTKIFSGSTFKNYAVIENSGMIYNFEKKSVLGFYTEKGGHIMNGGGAFYNFGWFANSGDFTIDSTGSVFNYGTISNNGTITNGGTFTNICQGTAESVSGIAPKMSPCMTPVLRTRSGSAFSTPTPTINGSSDANALIRVSEGQEVVGQVVADSGGNWTVMVNPLTVGTHTLAVQALGVHGNSSSTPIQVSILAASGASSSSSSSTGASGSGSGGIPEFPYQILAALMFTLVVVTSYLLVRGRQLGVSGFLCPLLTTSSGR